MKEINAKSKWCPYSSTFRTSGGGSYNRLKDNTIPPGTKCLGSACMKWRWSIIPGKVVMDVKSPDRISDRDGYCDA